jgi:hypothetical protein
VAQIHATRNNSCLLITVTGALTADEIVGTVSTHYPGAGTVPRLWDLRKADLSAISETSLLHVAKTARQNTSADEVVKTAYVTSDFATYALVTRYVVQAFSAKVRAEYRVFGNFEAAKTWVHEA